MAGLLRAIDRLGKNADRFRVAFLLLMCCWPVAVASILFVGPVGLAVVLLILPLLHVTLVAGIEGVRQYTRRAAFRRTVLRRAARVDLYGMSPEVLLTLSYSGKSGQVVPKPESRELVAPLSRPERIALADLLGWRVSREPEGLVHVASRYRDFGGPLSELAPLAKLDSSAFRALAELAETLASEMSQERALLSAVLSDDVSEFGEVDLLLRLHLRLAEMSEARRDLLASVVYQAMSAGSFAPERLFSFWEAVSDLSDFQAEAALKLSDGWDMPEDLLVTASAL